MEEAECCICLQAFEEEGEHIPRVLGCGHTLCHSCVERLAQLQHHKQHQQQWFIVRCPECSYVAGIISPWALPKNIELLRLSRRASRPHHQAVRAGGSFQLDRGQYVLRNLLPGSCSAIVKLEDNNGSLVLGELDDGEMVCSVSLFLVAIGNKEENCCGSVEYEETGERLWQRMSPARRKELKFLVRLDSFCHAGVCRVLGMWLSEQNRLYLVNKIPGHELTVVKKRRGDLLGAGLEICEILLDLHSQGLLLGVLGMEMFQVNDFGHIMLHWNGALSLRQLMHQHILTASTDTSVAWQYISPEMLVALLTRNIGEESISEATDVWSFACFLIHVVFNLPCQPLSVAQAQEEAVGGDKKQILQQQIEGSASSIEPWHATFQEIMWKCFSLEPKERPSMVELWQHLKRLQSADCSETVFSSPSNEKKCCFALQGLEVEEETFSCDEVILEADALRNLEETRTLEGHADSITCLAVCGPYLISSSFDRTVRVWSLQDGALLWCWEGQHSQRVLAMIADEASEICFTGDYGGAICAWKVGEPFAEKPIVKWQEHTDWRFTGVSALAISQDGMLYSGSGDKSIKAWCSKSYNHITTLQGHRALVSALAVDGGLLYSGSWDGCIRLWFRSDHSPMSVLGGSNGAVRALALLPHQHVVISSHDNGCIQAWKNSEICGSNKVHDGVVSALAVVEGNWLVTGGWDRSIKIWHINDILAGAGEAKKSMSCDAAVMSVVSRSWRLYAAVATQINVFSSSD